MKVNIILRSLIKEKGITYGEIAETLNKASKQAVASILSRSNLTINTIVEFANLVDYDVVLKPKKRSKEKKSYIVDNQ